MPDRAKMRPTDADGFREAWATLERLWDDTDAEPPAALPPARAARACERRVVVRRDAPPPGVRQRAAWVGRMLLGDPSPWHPLDLPWDEAPGWDGIPWDRDVRPTLEEVLALRARAAGDGARRRRRAHRRAARVDGVADRTGVAADRAVPVRRVPADRVERRSGSTGCTPSATSPRSAGDDLVAEPLQRLDADVGVVAAEVEGDPVGAARRRGGRRRRASARRSGRRGCRACARCRC